MNAQKEFEIFHYHASCAVTHFARMLLAITAKGLEWVLKIVNLAHGKLIEPRHPDMNYEVHVQ